MVYTYRSGLAYDNGVRYNVIATTSDNPQSEDYGFWWEEHLNFKASQTPFTPFDDQMFRLLAVESRKCGETPFLPASHERFESAIEEYYDLLEFMEDVGEFDEDEDEW